MKPAPVLNRLITNSNGIDPNKVREEIKSSLRGAERYPFLFLIDISGSTGEAPDPDIVHINSALNLLLDKLRNPPAGSQLQKNRDLIDVCIVSYSDDPDLVLDWMPANKLPATIKALKPLNDTCTAKALLDSIEKIGERLRDLRTARIPFGHPHIVHLTDGAMKDSVPGDALWQELTSRLTRIDGRGNSEKKYCTLVNFITPKGMKQDFVEINGKQMSGKDLLEQLCGDKVVFDMGKTVGSFEEMVNLVARFITNVTNNFGTKKAIEGAAEKNTPTRAAS